MMSFFRNRFTVFLISTFLLLGFFIKASNHYGCKWNNLTCEAEEKQLAEEEKCSKEEKSSRSVKKNWDYSSTPFHLSTKLCATMAQEAHNRVYLLALISKPLIPIHCEPPNSAKEIALV